MWQYQVSVDNYNSGKSIKEFLIDNYLPKHLRGALRQHKGLVVNGQIVATSYVLKIDDCLTMRFNVDDFYAPDSYRPNYHQAIKVIYENNDLMVLDKPAGMKMHAHSPSEDDTLLNYAAAYLKQNQTLSAQAPAQPYMVHRLDRDTSGLVLIAKNPIVVPILNRQLSKKEIQRTYYAWVKGHMSATTGIINRPIGQHPTDDRLRWVDDDCGQTAQTGWRVVEQISDRSLLKLVLSTGRMHQIRVHLASVGHPIIGDSLYGGLKASRLMLQAGQLDFIQPFSGKNLSIKLKNNQLFWE
ncbi:RluA family pseudouridine synthase [Convivina praedatoris]|uniref:Pseudouridine synthase n=1 Tax=Convivina praedatoris TaxID=2880963 RepID=A0ABN8HE45_9LACO|nr:RluA family pseudouridine synthase [Convivina sp. LMG 32447]CAH1856966.1 hypothetical protein R077815_01512 [Convivina sp. LMG 32447]CAH1857234.1 hypothetical protein R078138_01544 [Convivina sp. LMG 32447]CAH1857438.1 hypothetical protein LMG032447_01544 [Convivina sp. LMG 32447]